ncbi:MAG: hypothetical protein BA066_03390 [Candidatus Korarchaeota archaeon NZ13-K]|nr:MAG: hypothetical protein BA066_03390 [Candidatus Korarchaeota archaeon NZ13-K]
MEERDEPDWVKLPHALQSIFFERVEEEVSSLIGEIERLERCIELIRDRLSGLFEPYDESDSVLRIGAVDGSRSPEMSERLGIRYGVFTTGAVVLEGGRRVRESYYADSFRREQAASREVSSYLLDLRVSYAERKLALELLDDVDFLFIDGSFYGFVYPVLRMRKRGAFGEMEESLFREMWEVTGRLVESGKVAGVVKRSHTRAIGGFIATKLFDHLQELGDLVGVIDKLILSALMPPRSIFRYESLIGEENVTVYTEAARAFLRHGKSEDLLEFARKKAYEPFDRLGLDPEGFRRMRRVQVKSHPGAPVCEIEHPSAFERVIEVIRSRGMFSDVTGLPLALDVVDSLVDLGSRFTEEYVSEIEARLLERMGRERPKLIRWFFHLLNPQKVF